MIKRYNKKEMKKQLLLKVIIGSIISIISLIGLSLTENIKGMNRLEFEIIFSILFLIGLFIIALIGINLRRLDQENRLIELENYILEYNNNVSLLYELYLNNSLYTKLIEKVSKVYLFPNSMNKTFMLELVKDNKRIVFNFTIESIFYLEINDTEKYYDEEDDDWIELPFLSFESESSVIKYLLEKYNQ